MVEADKQKLVALFNDVAGIVQQISIPVAQGMVLGSRVANLGQAIDALSVAKPVEAVAPPVPAMVPPEAA